MARTPRRTAAGLVYHVTARGNRHQPIVLDDTDRHAFRALLAEVVARCTWRILAWCLLDNHFHLVVETPDDTLSAGMHRLCGEHARRFNRRHGLTGHLFQGRFHSDVVDSDEYMLAAVRYVALNPVTAKICRTPRDWPWSSHGTVVNGVADDITDVARIVELFGAWGRDGHAAYLDWVECTFADLPAPALLPPAPVRPSITDLIAADGPTTGMQLAVLRHGYSTRDAARATGLSAMTVSRRVRAAPPLRRLSP